MDRWAAKREQRRVDPAAHDVKDVADAGRAAGRQAPQAGTADQHRAGAERERLDHVAAAAHAAVEQHLGLAADGLRYRRKGADRRRGPVEVVAAVVGHRDSVRTGGYGAPRVVGAHDALH
jgi:hypothetical protein